MISKELVETLVLKELSEEYFVVSISIKKGNFIEIVIDGDHGVNIQKCVDVSRSVEGSLDRETEDFELSVSSAGLGKPFKVYRQYVKNIGKEVEVTPAEGKPISGIIQQVNEDGFDLQVTVLERPENSKKKVEVVKTHHFAFNSMPKVKNIISFK